MKNLLRTILLTVTFVTLYNCGDIESIHEKYLTGEKIYAGKLDSLEVLSGYKRVKIVGLTRYAGSSTECTVKWEDQTRIFPLDRSEDETFEMIIDGLEEKSYEFEVTTTDNQGNKSILQYCTGKAYGDIFRDSQQSRRIKGFSFSGTYFSAEWADKAESEHIVRTLFKYENNANGYSELTVYPDDNITNLIDWKAGGKYVILSEIVTGDFGFDTIPLIPVEGLLPTDNVFALDKSLFASVRLKNDILGDGYGGKISGMWDGVKGSAQDSRYHSRDGEGVPHTVTIDLGVLTDLKRVEICGRGDHHNWNPKRFQIWGCSDIEGKDTNLPSKDANWEQEAHSKGWELLLEGEAVNPIENLFEMSVISTQKVRYIRYRVTEVIGPPSVGQGAYGCVQEITFWGANISSAED
jgi:hypothetical protein